MRFNTRAPLSLLADIMLLMTSIRASPFLFEEESRDDKIGRRQHAKTIGYLAETEMHTSQHHSTRHNFVNALRNLERKQNLSSRTAPTDTLTQSISFQGRALTGLGDWVQIGQIEGEAARDLSGTSVSLSRDGRRLAIASIWNDGNGIDSGHVRIYEWKSTAWEQLGAAINGEAENDWSGASVSMSYDGSRVAIATDARELRTGGSGHVRVFQWDGFSWNLVGKPIEKLGVYASLSEDGARVAVLDAEFEYGASRRGRVHVHKFNGLSWKQMGDDIYFEENRPPSFSLALAGNGEKLVVGHFHSSNRRPNYIRVLEWSNSDGQWKRLGKYVYPGIEGDRFGTIGSTVAISHSGDRFAVGGYRYFESETGPVLYGYVRVYEWEDSSWAQMGDDIETGPDWNGGSVSVSSDLSRLMIGNYGSIHDRTRTGHARVYEWDGASWKQLGSDLVAGGPSYALISDINYGASMSGDGELVVITANHYVGVGQSSGLSRVFKLAGNREGPFPTDFVKDVTCIYLDCLQGLLEVFSTSSTQFDDEKLDRYAGNSISKAIKSLKKIKNPGDVVVSLNRLKHAMKWIELVGSRGSNLSL